MADASGVADLRPNAFSVSLSIPCLSGLGRTACRDAPSEHHLARVCLTVRKPRSATLPPQRLNRRLRTRLFGTISDGSCKVPGAGCSEAPQHPMIIPTPVQRAFLALFRRNADAEVRPKLRQDAAPFQRRCDSIAQNSQRTFLFSVTGGVVLFAAWAALTELDQVTRGAGSVVPQSDNQVVQHLEGGIVTDIFVRNGDRVERGEPLMRIENSFAEAELARIAIELKANRVKLARLSAEARGDDELRIPRDLVTDIGDIVKREAGLFQTRRQQLQERFSILDDQVRQKDLELSELKSRWANISQERRLVLERVQNLRRLEERGGVSRNELLESERTLQQIESALSGLTHQIPRIESALNEARGRRREGALQFQAEAENERIATEVEIARLRETTEAMQDRNRRSDVTAPISGIINRVFVTTIGGVVKSGQPLVQLVPAGASIAVEARLSPEDRSKVWPGLPAVVKISAYDFSIHGGLAGKITEVSPDALQDEEGGSYFRIRLEADGTSLGPDKPVLPGMVAQVDIMTGRQTILSYLLKPLRRVRDNALRQ
jgi:adhesin transport system membrane fusion protein